MVFMLLKVLVDVGKLVCLLVESGDLIIVVLLVCNNISSGVFGNVGDYVD